jgi:hypothetical protein
MSAATPRTIKTRSGTRKAVAIDAHTFEIHHCRIEGPRLGIIKVDEKMGDPWFYPEGALFHADQLRDIVYLMDRVGRKGK